MNAICDFCYKEKEIYMHNKTKNRFLCRDSDCNQKQKEIEPWIGDTCELFLKGPINLILPDDLKDNK